MLEPWWRTFFWNMATVQFDHRSIAWLLAIVTPLAWWKIRAERVAAPARSSVAAGKVWLITAAPSVGR
jgi:cytochrome c oxidase assembly protein subunit 15